ncbi:MAG: TonB-dependent receptor domain-containing protein, partial [Bryobacteraceae bacterium]
YAPSSSRFGGWQINQLSMRSQSATAGANVRWSPRLVQDFRVNYSYASAVSLWRQADGRLLPNCHFQPFIAALNLNNNVCESFLRFSIAGIGQIVSGRETDNRQRQWNLIESMAWSLGSHQLRFGMDYRRLAPDRRGAGTRVSILSEGLADLLADRNLWISTSATEQAGGLLEEWSVFAQDTWRVTPRLTLSYGVRWELNPPPTTTQPVYGLSEGSNPFSPPVVIETALWPLRYSNFAPRLGVAYGLGQNGNTVIRAGAGLYFDSSLSVATDLVNEGPFNVTQFVNPARQVNFLARLLMGYGFLPGLRLPEVRHWNISVDHMFGGGDAVSAGYIGSAGRRLLRREMGGPESNERVRLVMATNHGQSEYHSLQLQYRRRMGRRWHGLVSYAWSHSIDTASADGAVHWVGSGLGAGTDRGSSDFDARHAMSALLTYNLPGRRSAGRGSKLLGGWSLDGALRARTGFPFSVVNAEHNLGVNLVNVFRPDLAPGNPIWVKDASAPGQLRLNRAAFQIRSQPAQGNLGRNSIAGFGMVQLDAALQREFAFDGHRSLLLRVEALNATNHANLADPVRFLSSPLFGESPSMLNLMLGTGSPATGLTPALQLGGARSIQLGLRFRF